MDLQHLADLPLDRVQRIERGHRLLEDDADVVAAHRAELGVARLEEVLALEEDLARRVRGRGRQELHHRQRGDRLARSRLADERDGLALADVEARALDRDGDIAALAEFDAEIADREERRVSHGSREGLARVEGVADGFADEDEKRQHHRDDDETGERQPRRMDVFLALRQKLTQRGRSGRQPEAEEIERGERRDRAVEDERQEGQCRHHGVGQEMPEHDRQVRRRRGPGRR